MPIFTALSTFERTVLEKPGKCTVCGCKHGTETEVIWKNYKGKFGICRLILCDENCHAQYDLNYWQNQTDKPDNQSLRKRNSRIYGQAEKEQYGFSSGIVTSAREADLDEIIRDEERREMRNYEV